MMIVLSPRADVEIAFHGAAQRMEKMFEHFSRCVAYILAGEFHIPLKIYSPSDVHQHQSPSFVHRQHEAVALYATLVAQGAKKSFAECYRCVLNRVVFVDLKIAFTLYF